jgi:AGZA family xanthine/uracil permease-like MFS transporter
VLLRRSNPFAFLASIVTVTALAWMLGYAEPPAQTTSAPDFSSAFLQLDIAGALQLALLPAIVALLFTDLFDSLSTFIGVANAAGLTEPDGRPINLRRGLIVDAFATFGAGLAGTSSGTAFVESIAGIRVGARTGRASVVTALCFLPCLFIAPLAAAVPGFATAAVLVLVGLAMFQTVSTLDFRAIEDALPPFVTIVLIPLTLDHAGDPVGLHSPRAALRGHRPAARSGACAVDPGGDFSGAARAGSEAVAGSQ